MIEQARAGDDAAVAVLYERHVASARRFAKYCATAPADVDDIVSEAFTLVLSAIRNGGGPRRCFRAYLLTIVRRTADRAAAQAKRAEATPELEDLTAPIPFEDPVLAGLETSMAARAFAALPERWQTVLWHTEVEGETPAQVAPLLGLSANGAAALAYRAREGLRTAYVQEHLSAAEVERNCQACASKLAAYLRGTVTPRARKRIEKHLAECDRCPLLLAELREVSSSLRGLIGPVVLGPVAAMYAGSRTHSPAGPETGTDGSPAPTQPKGRVARMRRSALHGAGRPMVITSLCASAAAIALVASLVLRQEPANPSATDAEPTPTAHSPWPSHVHPTFQSTPPSPRSPSAKSPAPRTPKSASSTGSSHGPVKAPPLITVPKASSSATASQRPSGGPTPIPKSVVNNAGFETPSAGSTYTTYRVGQSDLAGWKIIENSVDVVSSNLWRAAEGSQSLDLNGSPSGPTAGAIAQTFDTVPGHRYTITFSFAGNPECGPPVKSLAVRVDDATRDFTFDTSGHSASDMGWRSEAVRFTGKRDRTTLQFASTTDTSSTCGPVIDGIHLKAG
ncbi:choice-of-anchor C family protein [Streptomyces sp. SLBN-118]|uniref:choice-of-anchor C family protein n=1 Tax=Streptomyces sp. SLBN-118 TaxID=2768454 RepID=UPI0013585FEA|nr:choice-of-anchor C family protein [Streptomyces sp. SLBN-118]